jgi:exosortase
MFALVVWWIGSFVFAFGGAMFRAHMFPLLFLLFLVPAPTIALNYMVHFLQVESATAARLMFVCVGIPAKQDASVVAIPGLTLEVATECSSIRSSMMLVVTTVLTAHLLLRSVWAKGVVSLLAIPLSVAKNGLRIFILAILGVYVDQRVLDGPLHHQGGVVFFGLSLAGLFAMLWIAGWIERKAEHGKGKGLASVILHGGSGILVGSRDG